MEKNIEIDLMDKYDFVEKYDKKKVSSNLIDYIIKQAMFIEKNEKIKITINKKCKLEYDCQKMIKEALNEEYNRNLRQYRKDNVMQIRLLFLGIIFIFLSTLINERGFWKEMLIIIGWVPIWKMIEIELFSDVEGRRKRRIIKKLLDSEIIEKV